MSKRFGRNQKREMRRLEKAVETLSMRNSVLSVRLQDIERNRPPMVTCAIRPDFGRHPNLKLIESRIRTPEIAFQYSVIDEEIELAFASIKAMMVDKVTNELERQLARCFSEAIHE